MITLRSVDSEITDTALVISPYKNHEIKCCVYGVSADSAYFMIPIRGTNHTGIQVTNPKWNSQTLLAGEGEANV